MGIKHLFAPGVHQTGTIATKISDEKSVLKGGGREEEGLLLVALGTKKNFEAWKHESDGFLPKRFFIQEKHQKSEDGENDHKRKKPRAVEKH